MRDPVRDLDRRGRLIFALVLLFALLHAALYVVSVPTWDLFDEEQHLSYALYLMDDGAIPHVNDPVQQRILDSAIMTDRWSTLRIDRPVALEVNEFGLEGWSYESYHPPLYYALIAPLTLLSDDAGRELYAARLFGVLLLLSFAAICWGYARDWLRDADPLVWGTIVAISVSVPSVAAAAGRVNNDLLAGLLLAAGTLMASRLLEDRRADEAAYLGLLTAAAVLTNGQGIVLLLVAVAACAILLSRGELTVLLGALAVAPGAGALVGWSLWIWERYDTVNSANVFLDLVGPVEPLNLPRFVEDLWLNGWSSYWGAYDGGTLRWVVGSLILIAIVAGFAGLLMRPASWLHSTTGVDRIVLSGTLFGGLLAAAWIANDSGLAHPNGRMLIGVLPALTTLVVAGIRRLAGDVAAIQLGIASVALSGVYFLFWYVPFFY